MAAERDVLAEALHEYMHLDSESECDAVGDSRILRERLAARGWRLVPSCEACARGDRDTHSQHIARGKVGPSAEPGLDVERLAMAIPYPMMRRDEPWADFATRTAEYIAEKYAALTPDPDRLTEARDEAAYWRRQAIEAQGREGA